jgi:hypothetical protein
MKVQFNKPVTLGKDTFGVGQHDVPSEYKSHWFFEALVKDGSAVVLREEPAPEPAKGKKSADKDE